MKLFWCGVALLSFLIPVHAMRAAMTCASVREKTKSKKGKPACTFVDHTAGTVSGSTSTLYQCGHTRYRLDMYANSDCFVTVVK